MKPFVLCLLAVSFGAFFPHTSHGNIAPNKVLPFSADVAYDYIQQQVNMGPRVPNTKAHKGCGNYLAQQLAVLGATVQVQCFQVQAFDGKTLTLKNIIGSFNPTCTKRILLAAHWDTRPVADKDKKAPLRPMDAANDGASGVGVLLAIAQVIHQYPLADVGIDIIFFDGEDYGPPVGTFPAHDGACHWCLGAQHWALHPHHPQYTALFGILLDMVGAYDATFYREKSSMLYAPDLVHRVWAAAQQLGHGHYFIPQDSHGHMLDDHIFVNQARVPMISIVDHWPGKKSMFKAYHHTHKDNLALIDKETLRAVGETLVQVIYSGTF